MAPEIEEKSMYSPIKADRWSTGKVLLHFLDKFGEEDTVLRTTAGKLTAHDPEQRPSMLQVRAEDDGENAKPLGVKKQKLSAPDRNKRFVFAEHHEPQIPRAVHNSRSMILSCN